ncbi:hypothetical protein ACF05T_26865 [Streptomyces lateritius]|uniref:Uncharacterized protein n=1 Tax=Streptomyces lateritius TaxID=67313 RepID=A0ABW6YIU6_9ACTN
MVELNGVAPTSRVRGTAEIKAVTVAGEALVGIAERNWSRRSAAAAELTVHIART